MELSDIKTALLTISIAVFHFFAETEDEEYIVWAEDGEGSSGHADNQPTTIIIEGTVDYFTKEEYDNKKGLVESALRNLGCALKLNSIQYEADTGYIHYEWIWQVNIHG